MIIQLFLGILIYSLRSVSSSPIGNCSKILLPKLALATSCPSNCIFEPSVGAANPYCREKTICDVHLNYTLDAPYGCPTAWCEVLSRREDDTDFEYCGPLTFQTIFEHLYWGQGTYPFGYLFWNIMVALFVIIYLQYFPRILGLIVTRLINSLFLNSKNELLRIQGLSFMIIGGRVIVTGIEYLSPNVHLKCVELSVNIKWWRGASDIRQAPSSSTSQTTVRTKVKKLPFRMSIYFTGLEISIFNNTGKYDVVEEYVLRTIYRSVYHKEPPITPSSTTSKTEANQARPSSRISHCLKCFFCCFWRRRKKTTHSSNNEEPLDPQNNDEQQQTAPPSLLEPLPRVYHLFPITRFQVRNFVLYLGCPTIPTTLIVHVKRAVALHFTELIGDAPNKELDSYRLVTKTDFRSVVVSMHANPCYVADEELREMRKKFQRKSVDARDVFSEIFRNVKESWNDVRIGVKDVRADFGQTLGQSNKGTQEDEKVIHPHTSSTFLGELDENGKDTTGGIFQSIRRNLGTKKMDEDDINPLVEHQQSSIIDDDAHEVTDQTYAQEREDHPDMSMNEQLETKSVESKLPQSQNRKSWFWFWGNNDDKVIDDEGTFLRSRLDRQEKKNFTRKVTGMVTGVRAKRRRQTAEPEILKAGKIELFIHVDQPGKVSQSEVDSQIPLPSPRQSVTVNIGGGDPDEETIIVYGPWADKQRALFQEHFFPYIYEDQKIYIPQLGKFREATEFEVKIVFSRFAEIRLPYRERDIGILTSPNGNLIEDSGFWFELQKKLFELREEERKKDDLENIKEVNSKLASQRAKLAKQEEIRKFNESLPRSFIALQDYARDGWMLCEGFEMDAFLDYCKVDPHDDVEMRSLVDTFNAISAYQTALTVAIPSLNHSLIKISGSFEEKARWLWGEYNGRESLIFTGSNVPLDHLMECYKKLPIPHFLQYLKSAPSETGVDLLKICKREQNLEKREELELMAYDPRNRLGRWFHLPDIGLKRKDESDSHAPQASDHKHLSISTQLPSIASLPSSSHHRLETEPYESYNGPISNASTWNTSCGWVDISIQPGSSIVLNMDYYPLANEEGTKTTINVDLKKPHMYCSTTRCSIADAASSHIVGSIFYPLAWNGEQVYTISIGMQSPRFRALREDLQSLSDLGKDWSSNSIVPNTLAFFIPTVYNISFTLMNAEFLFNANENNVVDLPEDTMEHNTHISLTIPTATMQVISVAREFQDEKTHFDVSVLWVGDPVFHLPVRLCLILPTSHSRRAVPIPVSGQLGQGAGGASPIPDPVFLELQRFQLEISYTYHNHVGDGLVDILEADVRFENGRVTAEAEAILAMSRFQQNYMGAHICFLSRDAYRAFGAENYRTLLSYRNWYETKEGHFRRVVENEYEMQVRFTFVNTLVFVPTLLYPRTTADGIICNPEEDTITIFMRENIFETRSRVDQFVEYSADIAPFRVQVPGSSKSRSDQISFQDSFGTGSLYGGAFARLWLRSANTGTEVGQLVINGVRIEQQGLYGRALRDGLAPSIQFRSSTKMSLGSIWGDLEVAQIAQIKDALQVYDLKLARANSFDFANGGTRDPTLCPDLPLGQRVFSIEERFTRAGRVHSGEASSMEDQYEPGHNKRKSSLFGPDFDGLWGDPPIDATQPLSDDEDPNIPSPTHETSSLDEASALDGANNNIIFFRLEVGKGSSLSKSFKELNPFLQVVYGAQGFCAEFNPETSDWKVGYTLLAGVAAHHADTQDLKISIFDGTNGSKKRIGEVIFPASVMKSALDSFSFGSIENFEGSYVLDASNAHYSFRSKTKLGQQLKPTGANYLPCAPSSVVFATDSKPLAIKVNLHFFSIHGSIPKYQNAQNRPQGRTLKRVFESASSRWNRDPPTKRNSFLETQRGIFFPVPDMPEPLQPGDLVLDPRVTSVKEFRNNFLYNAAIHLQQDQAMKHVVNAYAHNTFDFSSGPITVCAWNSTGDSFVELSIGRSKLKADSEYNSKFSWKVSTEDAEDISILVRNFKRNGKVNDSPWYLVGKLAASFDVRIFGSCSDMESERKKQALFLEMHNHHHNLKRVSKDTPLAALAIKSVVTELNVSEALMHTLALMPKICRKPVTESFFQSTLSKMSSDSHLEYASCDEGDSGSSFGSAVENSYQQENDVETQEKIYVATRFSTLPMDGPADPYGTSITNLEPFLEGYKVERFMETTDYWYGSAFGWATSGNLISQSSSQTREMGIAPSSRTEIKYVREPAIALIHDSTFQLKEEEVKGTHNRNFNPVTPSQATSTTGDMDRDDPQTISVRIHAAEELEIFLTPASIAFAEDSLHRWFTASPTITQMMDYFEKNYLVLSPSLNYADRLAPSSKETKLLVSAAKGVSFSLLHGSKISSSKSVNTSLTPDSSLDSELVYSTRFSTGPLTVGKSSLHTTQGVSYDNLAVDVSNSCLVIQVASAFEISGRDTTSSCFPVVNILVKGTLLSQCIEEREGHRSSSMSASFQGAELISGVDSVYVTYSVFITWTDLLSGLSLEGTAIWHRERRQWAILAGQLLTLSKRIDETDLQGIGDKEPRLGLALMMWCRSEAPPISHNFSRLKNYAVGSRVPALLDTQFDSNLETPLHGWSTLIRSRRIACFLSEYTGTEERMRTVEIDRHPDAQPVVSLQTVSNARNLFPPEFFEKVERTRSNSKDGGISLVLVSELLYGVANRFVVKRKQLGSSTISYEMKLEKFVMRVLDSSLREVTAPKDVHLDIPAIAMRPANVLCMFVQIRPSELKLVRYGKKGVVANSKMEPRDRRASDLQIRNRFIPNSIIERVNAFSLGIDVTTSPELVLASRAGATVFARYQTYLDIKNHERKIASENHKKENDKILEPERNNYTQKGIVLTAPIGPASSIAFHTNAINHHRSEDFARKTATLEQPSHGFRLIKAKDSAPIKPSSERFHFDTSIDITEEVSPSSSEIRANSMSMTRTRSSASLVGWDSQEMKPPPAEIETNAAIRPEPLQTSHLSSVISPSNSISSLVSPSTQSERGEKKSFGRRRLTRGSYGFTSIGSEKLFGKPEMPKRLSEVNRNISFEQTSMEHPQSSSSLLETREGESTQGEAHVSVQSDLHHNRRVTEKRISIVCALHSAVFRFSSRSLQENRNVNDEAVVTFSLDNAKMSLSRQTNTPTVENDGLRDFILMHVKQFKCMIQGAGHLSQQGKSWFINGEVDNIIMNALSTDGATSLDASKRFKVYADCNRSRVEVPLHAIDNKELQQYLDGWVSALRLASEHAEVIRVGTLERKNSFQNKAAANSEPSDEAVLLSLGLSSIAQQFSSNTFTPKEVLVSRGVGRHGVWPDPFGIDQDDKSVGGESELSSSAPPSPAIKDQKGAGTPPTVSLKRQSTTNFQPPSRDKSSTNIRIGGTFRMHDLEIHISPLQSVTFTTEFEHLTLALDRPAIDKNNIMFYLGPSNLTLGKLQSSLELKQTLPCAWILAKLSKSHRSSRLSSRKVTVLVEAVRHSFTPSVIQQFLHLQSALSSEIAILLEAATKFSEERRRNTKVKYALDPEVTHAEYSFHLQGVSIRAKESSKGSIWGELESGGLELRMNTRYSKALPQAWTAKVNDLKLALLSSRGLSVVHLFKVLSNVDLTNIPKPEDEPTGMAKQQTITLTIDRTSAIVRPNFIDGFAKWYNGFLTALDRYHSSRTGLENVDMSAKKMWSTVRESSVEKDYVRQRFALGTQVFRVIVTDSSFLLPVVEFGSDLRASVSTLKRIEVLARIEKVFENQEDSFEGDSKPMNAAMKLSKTEIRNSKRRNSAGNLTSSTKSAFAPIFQEGDNDKRVFVLRMEATELKSSVVSKDAGRLLALRWIPSCVHQGSKCFGEIPQITLSLYGEEFTNLQKENKIQAILTISPPQVKCDRSIARFLVSSWQTYLKPRPEDELILRVPGEKSSWEKDVSSEEDDWTYSFRAKSGSFEMFVDPEPNQPLPSHKPFPQKAGQGLSIDFSIRLEPGKIEFWGEEVARITPTYLQQSSRRLSKLKGPRQAMVAAQRIVPENEVPQPDFLHPQFLKKRSSLSSMQRDAQANPHQTSPSSERLFLVALPSAKFGFSASGTVDQLNKFIAHLAISTDPFNVSPTVLAFFEELTMEVKATVSELEAGYHSLKTPRGSIDETNEPNNPVDRSSMLMKGVFTVSLTNFELNLKSTQDQPNSSLKLRLEEGFDFVWSNGEVQWDVNQAMTASTLHMTACTLHIPLIEVIVHELNPVIQSQFKQIKIDFNQLRGVFAEEPSRYLYTCLNSIESALVEFNFWRIEAFFALKHDWDMAWEQVIEERKIRKEFEEKIKETHIPLKRSRSGDETRQQKIVQMLLKRASSAPTPHISSSEQWQASVILFVSTRIKQIKFEAKLGVLASIFQCTLDDVASRLALPGQLASKERNPDSDTFYLNCSKIYTSLSGHYEGSLNLTPGISWYVAREKPSIIPPKQEWQPWHDTKTTLIKSYFRCGDINASLARVLSGEKRTKTNLLRLAVSKINFQLKDEFSQEDGVVSSDCFLKCNALVAQISVDAPPMLSEAAEQLWEQIQLKRFTADPKTKLEATQSAEAIEVLDPATSRAFRAVGKIRVRFNSFDLFLVHDPSNTAWGTSIQFLGARLISKKSNERVMIRDLTLQTNGADIFRYHGHNWKGVASPPQKNLSSREEGGLPSPPSDDSSDEEISKKPEKVQSTNNESSEVEDMLNRPLSQEDAARRSTVARRAVISKRGRKTIIAFPKSTIIMFTEQHLDYDKHLRLNHLQPAVIYKFTSTFRDAISVSTDRREYAKLREIISLLKFSSRSESTEEDDEQSRDSRQFQQADIHSFVLEPQLNIMGEATTAVLDWFFDENIQLKKNELPKQVHLIFTDTLETSLAVLSTCNSTVEDAFNLFTGTDDNNKPVL